MRKIDKLVRPGGTVRGSVFCRIQYDGKRLSITGVEGPMRNGDCRGSAGQIADTLSEITTYATGWDADKVARFADTWCRWHLNDMRPGCEHQRAEGWGKRPIDPSKPLNTYGRHFPGQGSDSWNMLAWVRPDEHPAGLLTKPCPVCGYKYGTSWLTEDVPAEVIEYLASLPDADTAPAWV